MEEEKKVGAEATTEETGTTEVTETKKSFEELLEDKEYQSAHDKKVAQALQTARTKWEEEARNKVAEAEKLAKMNNEEKTKYEKEQLEKEIAELKADKNARALKDEAIKMIAEKDIPVSYLDLFDFGKMTAEDVKTKIESIEKLRAKDRESYLNKALKEETPKQKGVIKKEEDPYLKGFDM